uniref:Uncharacterized protein n=1 Tax=Rhizophora mucronata TaxID=61149 RepID=A0A2P2IVI0_RHIMU
MDHKYQYVLLEECYITVRDWGLGMEIFIS